MVRGWMKTDYSLTAELVLSEEELRLQLHSLDLISCDSVTGCGRGDWTSDREALDGHVHLLWIPLLHAFHNTSLVIAF